MERIRHEKRSTSMGAKKLDFDRHKKKAFLRVETKQFFDILTIRVQVQVKKFNRSSSFCVARQSLKLRRDAQKPAD